jgi:predicted SAM-dependent methyltransferase
MREYVHVHATRPGAIAKADQLGCTTRLWLITMNIVRFKSRLTKLLSRYGIGAGRKVDSETAIRSGFPMKNLHLGCGNIHIRGYCNMDVIRTGATDVVIDIRELPGIEANSVESIYSCHVLEHFATLEVVRILERWAEVLKPGGEIRISVPDLDKITRIYQDNLDHFQVPGNQPWIALIYGGQKDRYDFHKTGFNFCYLKSLLLNCGFESIEEYPSFPHFIDGVVDNSMASEPFGEFISLNVKAIKG